MLNDQHYRYFECYTYHSQEQRQLLSVQQITVIFLPFRRHTLVLLNIFHGLTLLNPITHNGNELSTVLRESYEGIPDFTQGIPSSQSSHTRIKLIDAQSVNETFQKGECFQEMSYFVFSFLKSYLKNFYFYYIFNNIHKNGIFGKRRTEAKAVSNPFK